MPHPLSTIQHTHPAYRTACNHFNQHGRHHNRNNHLRFALSNARVTRFVKEISMLGITPSATLCLIPTAHLPLSLLSQLVATGSLTLYIPVKRHKETYPVYLSNDPYLYATGMTDEEETRCVYDELYGDAELYGWNDSMD